VLRAGLLCVPVIGCAGTEERTLVETLDTAEFDGGSAQGAENASGRQAPVEGPSGLINPDDRAATYRRLKDLSAQRSSTAPSRQQGASAQSLMQLRDTHGQNALKEIDSVD